MNRYTLLLLMSLGPLMASAENPLQWILNNRHSPLEISEKFVQSWGQDLDSVSDWRGMDFITPYDQAVCTIALLSEGKIEDAKEILTGLRAIQNPDGSFYFLYNIYDPLDSHVPQDKKFSAMASWTTMAANYYTYVTKDTQSGLPATQACCAGWYILAKNKLNPFKPYKISNDLEATESKLDTSEHGVDPI